MIIKSPDITFGKHCFICDSLLDFKIKESIKDHGLFYFCLKCGVEYRLVDTQQTLCYNETDETK